MSTEVSAPNLAALQRRGLPSPAAIFGAVLVLGFLAWLAWNAYETPSLFAKQFLIGLTNGSVYGLIALGYTLVYGILELINFAHGDVFMLGGMIAATIAVAFGMTLHTA